MLQIDAWLVEVVFRRNWRAQGPVEGGVLNFVDRQWHFMSGYVGSSICQNTVGCFIDVEKK